MPSPPPWLRKRLTFWNLVLLAVLVFAAPRLLPHLGAIVGVRSGDDIVPEWTAIALDGTDASTASVRGKVVLVNVWATWCVPCRAEMPLLEQMWQRHRDRGFVLLGLSVDRNGTAGVRRFLDERDITYPVAIVGPDVEQAFGGVRGIPTSFLLDRHGRIRHRVIGPLAAASLELAVRRLLDKE